MGKNNNKENENKEIIIDCMKKLAIPFIISVGLIVLIGILIKKYEGNDKGGWITLDGWLTYYGTVFGSILGGFITAAGLYITLKINDRQLDKQLRNENEKFQLQLQMQIINEKIKDYKICIENINEFIDINDILIINIDDYDKKIGYLRNTLVDIDNIITEMRLSYNEEKLPVICKSFNTIDNIFDLSSVGDYYYKSSRKLHDIRIYGKCIVNTEIRGKIENYISMFEESNNCFKFIIDFKYENNFSEKYEEYFIKNKELYNTFFRNRIDMTNNINKYDKVIGNAKVNFTNIKTKIENEIEKLYNEKYSLDDKINEQKTSNNN